MEKVSECVERLQPLFKAVLEGHRDESEKLTAEILQLESDADAVKNEIRDHLPKTLFLPVGRPPRCESRGSHGKPRPSPDRHVIS